MRTAIVGRRDFGKSVMAAFLNRGDALAKLEVEIEIGIMAYVPQFVPQDFSKAPKHGMIQYHPSLLPR
jgi:methionyl-tRNA formyltransferase